MTNASAAPTVPNVTTAVNCVWPRLQRAMTIAACFADDETLASGRALFLTEATTALDFLDAICEANDLDNATAMFELAGLVLDHEAAAIVDTISHFGANPLAMAF